MLATQLRSPGVLADALLLNHTPALTQVALNNVIVGETQNLAQHEKYITAQHGSICLQTPALRRLRREDCKCKANLDYTARPVSKAEPTPPSKMTTLSVNTQCP